MCPTQTHHLKDVFEPHTQRYYKTKEEEKNIFNINKNKYKLIVAFKKIV